VTKAEGSEALGRTERSRQDEALEQVGCGNIGATGTEVMRPREGCEN
jgi:hypothetical protein